MSDLLPASETLFTTRVEEYIDRYLLLLNDLLTGWLTILKVQVLIQAVGIMVSTFNKKINSEIISSMLHCIE